MTNEIKTIDDVQLNSEKWNEEYKYQENLTAELDNHDGEFDQDIINQIVLWKVNRYAKPKDSVLAKINMIDKASKIENIALYGQTNATKLVPNKGRLVFQMQGRRLVKQP